MREADSHGGSWTAAAVPRQAPWRRPGLRWLPWLTLGVIAAGGVAGALARQGLWAVFPREAGFDWTTLGINVAGCGMTAAARVARVPVVW